MLDKTGIQEYISDRAHALAKMPVEDWARWVIYLLEILDGKDHQPLHRVWLEDIRDDINERLRHGRW